MKYEMNYDVAVVGGGPAGVGAALASARNGAKTILIEKNGVLGGQMTSGLVTGFHGMRIHKGFLDNEGNGPYLAVNYETEQVIKGIPQEVVNKLVEQNAAYARKGSSSMRVEYDPEVLKWTLFEMMDEAGVDLLLDTFVFDCKMNGTKIEAIKAANKSGEQLIKASMFVDASADGDLAAWSGAPYEMGREEDGRCMPLSLYMLLGDVNLEETMDYLKENPEELHNGKIDKWEKLYNEGSPIDLGGFRSLIMKAFSNDDYPVPVGTSNEYPYPIFFIHTSALPKGYAKLLIDMAYGINITDAKELTQAEIAVRMKQVPGILKFLKKYLPGFEECVLLSTASLIGTRESRRIVGDYKITEEDVLKNRRFNDVVARCGRAMNVHSMGGGKKGEARGGQKWIEPEDPKGFDIPFRALIPQKVDNLLASGRCISTSQMALGSVRGEPVCMATGEAAGTAAALCSKNKVDPRSIDIKVLQDRLAKQGVELGK